MSEIIEKCGRSGVELREIRRHVDAEGNDTSSRGKPKNNYLDNRIVVSKGNRGFNANRPRSCGFGPSKVQCDESMPSLTKAQRRLLVDIDDGKMTNLPRENRLALLMVAQGLIIWSETKGVYTTMADGRRVADLLRNA